MIKEQVNEREVQTGLKKVFFFLSVCFFPVNKEYVMRNQLQPLVLGAS